MPAIRTSALSPQPTASTFFIGLCLIFWAGNWFIYLLTEYPPYCSLSTSFIGAYLAQLYDGVRAIFFLWCLVATFLLDLRGKITAYAITGFWLMAPGLLLTLMTIGIDCSQPVPKRQTFWERLEERAIQRLPLYPNQPPSVLPSLPTSPLKEVPPLKQAKPERPVRKEQQEHQRWPSDSRSGGFY